MEDVKLLRHWTNYVDCYLTPGMEKPTLKWNTQNKLEGCEWEKMKPSVSEDNVGGNSKYAKLIELHVECKTINPMIS